MPPSPPRVRRSGCPRGQRAQRRRSARAAETPPRAVGSAGVSGVLRVDRDCAVFPPGRNAARIWPKTVRWGARGRASSSCRRSFVGAGGGREQGGSSSRRGRARRIGRARRTRRGGPCTSRCARDERSPRFDRRACSRSCGARSPPHTRPRSASSTSRCRAITSTSSSKATRRTLWSADFRDWRLAAPRPSTAQSDDAGACGSAGTTPARSALRPRRGAVSSTSSSTIGSICARRPASIRAARVRGLAGGGGRHPRRPRRAPSPRRGPGSRSLDGVAQAVPSRSTNSRAARVLAPRDARGAPRRPPMSEQAP